MAERLLVEVGGVRVVGEGPAGFRVFVDGEPMAVRSLTLELRPGAPPRIAVELPHAGRLLGRGAPGAEAAVGCRADAAVEALDRLSPKSR